MAVAIVATVLAQAAGRNYANNFSLPGTEFNTASKLLAYAVAVIIAGLNIWLLLQFFGKSVG